MLERDRELAEGAGDPAQKIWLIIADRSKIISKDYDELSNLTEFHDLKADEYVFYLTLERGWIWERDLDHNNFKQTYKLFEPVEEI